MQIPVALKRAQKLRKAVQIGFLITTLWIGFEFVRFVDALESGTAVSVSRPPGVEAFLPISSLISIKHWILTGGINSVHPAGLVIFLMVLSTALLLKKGFCSWICPFGLLSEQLAKIHRTVFGRNIRLPAWLDMPLRSLKYLLLLFFFWAILVRMDTRALEIFIYSPYNRVADIKMLKFFTDISTFSLGVLILLFLLSLLFRNFWCRYLCPYGALLGIVSVFSVTRIRREASTCTDCRKCAKVCPSDISVHRLRSVGSDECHACMQCVDACPLPGTLTFSPVGLPVGVKPWLYAAMLILLFAGGSTIAKSAGIWKNGIRLEEYVFHIHHLQLPVYQHHRGNVPVYDPDLFPPPGRFQSKTFQKSKEAFHGTHGRPDPRASEDSSSAGTLPAGKDRS
ncbi:MAG: 4Fe-4S binding protein [Deltaproteobacteria bacterium]|nr:4Fe-4S binding protein [Deltaproteobacteria bacterium]